MKPDNKPDKAEGREQQEHREVTIQGTYADTGEPVTLTARVNPGGNVKLTAPVAEEPATVEPAPEQQPNG